MFVRLLRNEAKFYNEELTRHLVYIESESAGVFPRRNLPNIQDCKQSLFSAKIRGEERKTTERRGVTVSVTYERRRVTCGSRLHMSRSHTVTAARLCCVSSLRYSARIFEQKKDCSQSKNFPAFWNLTKQNVFSLGQRGTPDTEFQLFPS